MIRGPQCAWLSGRPMAFSMVFSSSRSAGLGTRAAAARATAAARARCLRASCASQRIDHAAALFCRDLLELRPPLRHFLRGEAVLRAQQEKIVSRTEARMLEHAQRTAAARMLEPRLESKHFAHAEGEALRDRNTSLRFTSRAIAGIEDRRELVPARGGCRFDVLRDRPI